MSEATQEVECGSAVESKEEVAVVRKPRIAVLTMFQSLGPGLSYHKTTIEWHREMIRQGYDAILYVRQDCKDISDEMRKELHIEAVLPHVKKHEYKPNEEKVDYHEQSVGIMQAAFENILRTSDVIIAHDFMLLKTYAVLNDALRRATDSVFGTDPTIQNPPLILHVYHSNLPVAERPGDISQADKYPERLRWNPAPWSRPVSLSYSSAAEIANCLMIPHSAVGVLQNPFVTPSQELIKAFGTRWLDAEVLQVMPFCATRWESKGIKTVMKVFGHMVINGIDAFLMLVTANARSGKGKEHLERMKEFASKCGLTYGKDYLITSCECQEWASGVPRKFVDELQSYADLFIFASQCEMCPNVLGEAARYGQLIVIPENLSVATELTEMNVLKFSFPVKGTERYPDGENMFFACVAREIYAVLRTERGLRQRAHTRRKFSIHGLFRSQFEPLIYKPVPRLPHDMKKMVYRLLPNDDKAMASIAAPAE